MYLTLYANFRITLRFMKSNRCVLLLTIHKKFIIKPQSMSMIESFSPLDMKRKKLNLG